MKPVQANKIGLVLVGSYHFLGPGTRKGAYRMITKAGTGNDISKKPLMIRLFASLDDPYLKADSVHVAALEFVLSLGI